MLAGRVIFLCWVAVMCALAVGAHAHTLLTATVNDLPPNYGWCWLLLDLPNPRGIARVCGYVVRWI